MSSQLRRARIIAAPEAAVRPFPSAGSADDTRGSDGVASLREQARREGFEQGWRQAQETFEAETRAFRQQMAASLERMAGMLEAMISEYRERLLALAVDVGARIARARIAAGDPVAARALEEALALLPRDCTARVRAHPEDAAALREHFAGVLGEGRVELVEDATVSRGGCRVESEAGVVDATFETALELARQAVLGEGQAP